MKILFRGLSVAVALVWAGGVFAGEAALVVANSGSQPGAETRSVADAARSLNAAGVDIVQLSDGSLRETIQRLQEFETIANGSDAVAIVLAGQFIHASRETWFLPADSDAQTLGAAVRDGVPLSALLSILDKKPGRAILALAPTGTRGERFGPYLRRGIGRIDLPQGVTMVQGSPTAIADFIETGLAGDGPLLAAIRGNSDLRGAGFLGAGLAFRAGATTPVATQPPRDNRTAEDQRAWERAVGRDSAEAFGDYLDAFPNGRFADEARQRIDQIRSEPNRAARLIEDRLNLTRNQRREIQRDLSLLGYNTRGIDGIFGPGTRQAVTGWQRDTGRAGTGFLDRGQIDRIAAAAQSRAAELEEQERQQQAELERADRAYWREIGEGQTEAGLTEYLRRYPDGLFADEARLRLRAVRPPREQEAWQQAQSLDTPQAYRTFLQDYPDGQFAPEARRLLGNSEETRQAEAAEAALGLTPATRRAAEQRLAALGYEPGVVDGTFDGQTRRAIRRYQRSASLPVSGFLNDTTVVRLLADTLRDILR